MQTPNQPLNVALIKSWDLDQPVEIHVMTRDRTDAEAIFLASAGQVPMLTDMIDGAVMLELD